MVVKTKVSNKKITDHSGSAQQFRIQAREVLWALVETIADAARNEAEELWKLENEDIEASNRIEMQDLGELPVQFGSKSKKRKKRRYHNVDRRVMLSSIPPYDGTLIEHNIYKLVSRGDDCWCRVLGVGSTQPVGSHSVVQLLCCAEVIEVRRSTGLAALTCSDLVTAAERVQGDFEWRQAQHCPVGVHLKYWDQRYRLLSKYDQGVKLDAESWYSITPERIARQITQKCVQASIAKQYPLNTVYDCFSGCGGNTVPFAYSNRVGAVVAIDMDADKLEYLRHNAGVYEAADKVTTVCADVYPLLESYLQPGMKEKLQSYLQQWYGDQGLARRAPRASSAIIGNGNHVRFDGESDGDAQPRPAVEAKTSDESAVSVEAWHGASDHTKGEDSESGKAHTEGTTERVQSAVDPDNSSVSACQSDPSEAVRPPPPDLIVMSPPWGGPDYCNNDIVYDLSTMLPCGDGIYLLGLAAAVAKNVVYLLPKNADDQQIARIKEYIKKPVAIENVYLNNSCKVKVVYVGTLFKN